jgi:hypothetical protein
MRWRASLFEAQFSPPCQLASEHGVGHGILRILLGSIAAAASNFIRQFGFIV